jgi:hypothetical protein
MLRAALRRTVKGSRKLRARSKKQYLEEAAMCGHIPTCPPAASPAHCAAQVVAAHPEQGWSLLCNGVVVFDDYGELLPDGRAVAPPHAWTRKELSGCLR